ncbi:uncharacterized protein LOC128248302 [Octopus bimaculoides]|uniref:uncharacterized protein LOC128248302 n=1 Tax=Octopus bimaculoides TaxID=37653 RepID=UPI0022E4524D|nr:uncharacterized protein LOC128248302 [Octopus bimaculoides]
MTQAAWLRYKKNKKRKPDKKMFSMFEFLSWFSADNLKYILTTVAVIVGLIAFLCVFKKIDAICQCITCCCKFFNFDSLPNINANNSPRCNKVFSSNWLRNRFRRSGRSRTITRIPKAMNPRSRPVINQRTTHTVLHRTVPVIRHGMPMRFPSRRPIKISTLKFPV